MPENETSDSGIARRRHRRLFVWAAAGALCLAIALFSCRRPAPAPVTLSYFRLGWSYSDNYPTAEPLSQRFVRETGIHLKDLPVPENTLDQLEVSRKLLESDSGPDVLGIDLIWSGVLADDLLDLRPYLASEIPSLNPQLMPGYTVNGKIVAIPNSVQIGALKYRADLLRAYGYTHPPKTWDELETMAARIQAGERAKGRKDFWGYVWQGADSEALTCNALEWQASAGGGQIIESNRTVSVNNPAAIRAWQRARRWIGRISPPSVLAYRELDSINIFDSGGAAFNRVWAGVDVIPGAQTQIRWEDRLAPSQTGFTSMPGGPNASVTTLGGSGLAVSRHSPHPQQAIELVRFLVRAQIQTARQGHAVVNQPGVHESGPDPDPAGSAVRWPGPFASRPSSITANKYEQVAKAYMKAVHSVLTGAVAAPRAAAFLEKQLIQITGFPAGPPSTVGETETAPVVSRSY